MKFEWDPEKNEWLKRERGVSFEQILFHLSKGDVWKVANHPNQQKYPGQKIYFVVMDEYVYLVPYVERKNEIFSKTIIPAEKQPEILKTRQKSNPMKLDKEEKQLLEAYEKRKVEARKPSRNELERITSAAQNTFKKDRRITIHLYDHDFQGFKNKRWNWAFPTKRSFPG